VAAKDKIAIRPIKTTCEEMGLRLNPQQNNPAPPRRFDSTRTVARKPRIELLTLDQLAVTEGIIKEQRLQE
jgi:hypothetical protein